LKLSRQEEVDYLSKKMEYTFKKAQYSINKGFGEVLEGKKL
jgi:hypothetical protein